MTYGTRTTHTYKVTVVAEGPVNGTTARVLLGAWETYTPGGALYRLRQQAHRIADGLDPHPRAAWVADAGRVLVPVGAHVPDVPSALRAWCDDHRQQEAARRRLDRGERFTVGAADHSGRYTLTVQPTGVTAAPSPAPPLVAPVRGRRRTRSRHRAPRHHLEALAVTLGAVLGILALAVAFGRG
ncbi:hypothetical protein [Streptomyces sp. NRRL F-5135]|uniref:hypothetical protein n=1 Tax=Streptomyces sp. NRRL F-5135 TaxID=1463858 RepID=UPI0005654493|nr:hypothetical protein [Streptomyces sp. NRRL F-5135]